MRDASVWTRAGAVLLLVALASGFWVASIGRPLHVAVVAIHKLVAIAGVVIAFLVVNRLRGGAALPGAPLALIVGAVAALAAAVASGALLTVERPMVPFALRVAHGLAAFGYAASITAIVVAARKASGG